MTGRAGREHRRVSGGAGCRLSACALECADQDRHLQGWRHGNSVADCFLIYIYERGDPSRVYPIARGAARMIVALVGAATLADAVSGMEYPGITVPGAGILLMARCVLRRRGAQTGALRAGYGGGNRPLYHDRRTGRAGVGRCDGLGRLGLCRGWADLFHRHDRVARFFGRAGGASEPGRGRDRLCRILRRLSGVDPGDDTGPHRGGSGAARNLDPVRCADRMARLWRADVPGQADRGGADPVGRYADAALAAGWVETHLTHPSLP